MASLEYGLWKANGRMRCNERTKLCGKKLTLVPYCKSHVVTYHGWMQNPWLLEMTASEPLSLEEEFENQRSWHVDEHKITFIVLDAMLDTTPMVGDVNIFLLDDDDEGENVAEVEVMIAEAKSRRKGLATEAVMIMMYYARMTLGVSTFVAKIVDTNEVKTVKKGVVDHTHHFPADISNFRFDI